MMMDMPYRSGERLSGLTGVILAGGRNRRMGGSHKALLPFANELLIHRQLRLMGQLCGETILVTNEPRLFLPIVGRGVRMIADYYAAKGPLGGIHAALSLARHAEVWIVACGMPFISPHAARLMLEEKKAGGGMAVIPFIGGKLHPLHGIYDRGAAEAVRLSIESGEKRVESFLETIPYQRMEEEEFRNGGIDTSFVMNVNTPEDYERALRMIDSRMG
jgi:molybdopterin-guanine dinucleotide biosynthesis protein A